jgi:hypothetical protein
MKIKIIKESRLSKKDKKQKEKFVKGMKKNKDEFEDRYGDDAEKVMYATATDMAKKIDETSSASGGAVVGHASDEDEINEMYSTSADMGGVKVPIVSAEKEKQGHVERSQHQGLKNVMEDDDSTQPMQGGGDNYAMADRGTVWKLSDFADNSKNASRVFQVLKDAESGIGLEKMKNAILDDVTAQDRIKIMSQKFGYNPELFMKIATGDYDSVRKYYQFLINEFLFWSSFNPMASAQQYAGRSSLLSKPTKDLAYAHLHRYVKSPSKNNPKSLGQRVSAQADKYSLDKDLDPALYDLPEE